MLQSVYTTPGIGNLIHSMLPIEDRLRMDCVSKEIRTFHRQEVYPHLKSLDAELVMDEADCRQSGVSYVTKVSMYAESIRVVPNNHDLKLPGIHTMPRVKSLEYAVTMFVDVTMYDVMYRTSEQWASVEGVFVDLAEDDRHPLQTVRIVPGNIRFARTNPETGEETEAYVLEDQNEATHCAYYRRFGYGTIYIPMCMYRKAFCFHLPEYLVAEVAREQHGKKITYWDRGDAGSIGRLLLDFH